MADRESEVFEVAAKAEQIFQEVQHWEPGKFGAMMSTLISVYLLANMTAAEWKPWHDMLYEIGMRRVKEGFGGAERELRGPMH